MNLDLTRGCTVAAVFVAAAVAGCGPNICQQADAKFYACSGSHKAFNASGAGLSQISDSACNDNVVVVKIQLPTGATDECAISLRPDSMAYLECRALDQATCRCADPPPPADRCLF